MAYSNLANDGSLQQFSELWESSRYSQRISTHPGGSKDLREDEEDKHESLPKLGTPSWLSNALMRQQPEVSGEGQLGPGASSNWCSSCGDSCTHCMCATNLQNTSPSLGNHPYTDWLSAVPMGSTTHSGDADAEQQTTAPAYNAENANQMSENSRGREHQRVVLGLHMESATGGNDHARARDSSSNAGDNAHQRDESMERAKNWHEARLKAKVLTHPMFSQMLAAHVGCLRIATPVDQLPKIDEQLGESQHVIDKYAVFAPEEGEDMDDKEELDDFMRNYTMVLLNMQEQLQNHVRVYATEAMLGCWELEQQLFTLTGVAPGPGTGATMSDDEEEQAADSDGTGYETGFDAQDSTGGYGPLIPTETERSLMERVRQELKLELNEQGYRDKIVDVREEILRKRRAGKLPEGTTTVLKTWWNAHSKWPYPTEDEKERLIHETGLELKQVNNWFINQRKRNWHSNPLSASSDLKSKRKG